MSVSAIRKLIKNSNDGGTLYCADTNEYCILYNEKVLSPGRIRWTIMHEIGHIVLKHFEDFPQTSISRKGLTDGEYDTLEKEAEQFAFHVLAPPIILNRLKIKSANQIYHLCKLSRRASENRFNYQQKWDTHPYSDSRSIKVIQAFYDFIYQKRCRRCNYGFVDKEARYCPICGAKLSWGEGEMKYNGVELDENYKALICPRCENEEISPEGDYCAICGAYLINKCADIMDSDNYRTWVEKEGCGMPAAGYARYCIHCGNPTTYFQNKILKPWKEAKALLLGLKLEAAPTKDDDIPF